MERPPQSETSSEVRLLQLLHIFAFRNFRIRFRLVTQVLACLCLSTVATSVSAQSFGTYAGEFMQLGVGARSFALGGAGAAISEDVTAGYWNPAGLTNLTYPNVAGMYETRFDGTMKYQYGAFGLPIGSTASAALSVFHLAISDIKDTRAAFRDRNANGQVDFDDYLDTNQVRNFSNYDWGFLLSYADKYDSTLSYGVNAKVLLRKLDPTNKGIGFGVDVGIRYLATDRLILAAVGQDLTTTLLSYSTGTKELVSPTIKLGSAYHLYLTDDGYHRVIPTVDMDLRFEDRAATQLALGPISADFHLGAEYRFGEIFAIRGGYSDINALTVGAGLKLPKLNVDYAFMSMNRLDQLGNSHRISFAFTFEQEKWKRK